jgi:hypothetical protein
MANTWKLRRKERLKDLIKVFEIAKKLKKDYTVIFTEYPKILLKDKKDHVMSLYKEGKTAAEISNIVGHSILIVNILSSLKSGPSTPS